MVCLRSLTYNYIHNVRGRAMAIRASGGVITNNTIDHVAYAGIDMTPAFGAREGAFVGSVLVSASLDRMHMHDVSAERCMRVSRKPTQSTGPGSLHCLPSILSLQISWQIAKGRDPGI